jgi:hypothetical protein
VSTPKPPIFRKVFGNVFYHTFQMLPYLLSKGIFPAWEIRATQYGAAPDFVTIPGALDLAYQPPEGPFRRVSLSELRRRHARVLGNDWAELSRVWHSYFKIPARIQQSADSLFPTGRVLGLHYRGNDKLTSLDDSNPISQDSFLTLVRDFLDRSPAFDVIFAATDEFSFVEKLRNTINLPVINLGEVGFHKAINQTTPPEEKTDRAVLDCVLLSRCSCLIETSSALPSFTKILNPDIEIYRTAASKLFSDMPYFPVAHIPILPVTGPEARAILDATLVADWTHNPRMDRFKKTFAFSIRRPLHATLFTIAEKLGADEMITVHR